MQKVKFSTVSLLRHQENILNNLKRNLCTLRWRELPVLFRLADLTKNCILIHLCYSIVKDISRFDMYRKHVFPEDLRINVQ